MYMPPTITFKLTSPGIPKGEPSLFDLDVTASSFPLGYPLGWHDGWCLDRTANIGVPATYTAKIYSSYELDILRANPNFATIGNDPPDSVFPSVPYDSAHPAQPYMANLDIVNWLLNNVQLSATTYNETIRSINYINVPYYTVTGIGGLYTWSDIQQSIYQLLGDGQSTNPFLGLFDMNRVKAIVDHAVMHDGYVPDVGELINVVLDLGPNLQPIVIQTYAAKLGDFVWEDKNANGIQEASENGIDGALVKLGRDLNQDGDLDDLNEILASTVTGDDPNTAGTQAGYYEFKGLTPGLEYQVMFTKPAGFDAVSPRQQGADTALDSDALMSDKIVLAPSEFNRTIDAGFYKLAALGDRVWLDTNANGQQDAGENGVANVRVELYACVDDLPSGPMLAFQNTDANGNYNFTNLTPGDYIVKFITPAGYTLTTANVGADASDSDAGTGGLTGCYELESGETDLTADAGLVQLAAIGDRVWEDKNANGQQDAGENGIANAIVKLYTCVDDVQGAFVAQTTTDANGNYSFTGLIPGEYMVEFITPDGYTRTTANVGADGTDSDAATGGLTGCYELSPGETDNTVDAGFYKLAALGDRVWLDTNANGQQDAGENGVANVRVELYACVDDLPSGPMLAFQNTDANGNYNFTNLTPGDYIVKFITPAGYTLTTANVGADASDSDAGTGGLTGCYELESGETDLTADAGLYQKAAIGDRVWLDCDMDGQQDPGEPGVANVTVHLKNAGGNIIATTQTDVNGNYLFGDLTPGTYSVAFVKPTGYSFTTKDAGPDATDSDADTTTGMTINTVLDSGEIDRTWDAGLTADQQCVEFDFSGNTSVCGPMGNIRTYTVNGISVNVSAFSRDKTTGNFANAYLGAYGGGLGVTDSSESGAGNTHTVDNVGGRDNYVMFEFSQSMVLDSAFLGYVSGDSDLQVWIGNFNNAFNSHITLNDTVLSNMGFSEVNTTTLTTARLADLNAGEFAGNVIVIAADTTDTTPEDYFKIDKLEVCTLPCSPPVPPTACIGDYVWHDKNANGIQDAGENGIANVTVRLLNSIGTVLATTTTDASGKYGFNNLTPGDYRVQVVKPSDFYFSGKDKGGNDALDSDVDSTGKTILTNLVAGETDKTWDAGLYKKACIGDKVWEDKNHNYKQDVGEPGIGNVKVTLQTLVGGVATNVATTYTDAYGNYSFNNLDPGSYRLVFDKSGTYYKGIWMGNWYWGQKDVGTNDAIDADAYSSTNVAYTAWTTLESGEIDKTWDAAITPLVIDLNGDGVQTIARANSAGKFDLFGNGHAIESGWVSAQDGMLAVDANGNGVIDNIHELFGGTSKGDGFAKLGQYDSNADGVVDANDANFATLRVWRDANGDHDTDAGELMSLSEAGVASLKVGYTEVPMVDAQGNLHLERSSVTLSDGTTVDMTDVYFNVSADDAQAAGVETMSLAHFMSDNTSLDGLLANLGGAENTGSTSANASQDAVASDFEAARAVLAQLDIHEQLMAA